ncbi:MAG: Mannosyltransferase (PIG-V) [Pelotomaculum sp. PtaB.Bin104]|nr:MAG: Mannosyltransferase (PIG-V) [Pelotomaculum sp. PtaB.Bin104]
MELLGSILKLLAFTLVLITSVLILIRLPSEFGMEFGYHRLLKKLPYHQQTFLFNMESKNNNFCNNEPSHKFRFPLTSVVLLIVATRAAIVGLSYLMETTANKLELGLFPNFWYSWFIQDSPHYICVAENGYQSSGYDSIFIVFYPLYPYLIKVVNIFIDNYYFAGLIISNCFFVIACYYLYKLVSLEYNDEYLSRNALYLLILFPFSFFMNIIYTESLFLTLSTMVFYYARKQKWVISGVCGMLAALTKNQGLLLFIPIFLELLLSEKATTLLRHKKKKELATYLAKRVPCAFLPLAGFGAYLLINKVVTGEWFKFLQYQKENWGNTMWLFANSIKHSFLSFFDHDFVYVIGTYAPQLGLFFIVLFMILFSISKIRITYTLYSLIYLIFSYSPSALLSGPRYITGMAPIYIYVALLAEKNHRLKNLLSYSSIIFLLFFSLTFVGGGTY